MASTGSFGKPRVRLSTFVCPAGTTPSVGRGASGPAAMRPFTTSFTVPSPPMAITVLVPSAQAAAAMSMACPRASVARTRISPELARASMTVPSTRGCAVVAPGFTMTSVDTPAAYFYCSAVPDSQRPPATLRGAVAVGVLELLGIVGYALSIALFERGGATSGIAGSGADLAPGVLVAIYLGFAVLVALVVRSVGRGSRRALTPYLLAQAFGVVIAQPLLQATPTRFVGLLVLVVSLAGIGLVLAPATRRSLH